MNNIEDAVLDSLDFDLDKTYEERMEEKLDNALDKLGNLECLVESLFKDIAELKLVNNSDVPKKHVGRPRCAMYYDGKEITDLDLVHLVDFMGLTVSEITKHFYYVDKQENKIRNIKKCTSFINNRLGRVRKQANKGDR